MKYLIFGDVHGNLPSLEMLFIKERHNFDIFVCHGDVVGYGPWINESVDFLAGQANSILLKGNHEEYFINGDYPGNHQVAKAFFEYCYPTFDRLAHITEYRSEFKTAHYNIVHSIEGKYIFKDTQINNGLLKSNHIIGHSHQQFIRKIGDFALVNTGSLGQNREYINVSDYIIYNDQTGDIELKFFINDFAKLINEMKSRKYPTVCIDYYFSKKQTNG